MFMHPALRNRINNFNGILVVNKGLDNIIHFERMVAGLWMGSTFYFGGGLGTFSTGNSLQKKPKQTSAVKKGHW